MSGRLPPSRGGQKYLLPPIKDVTVVKGERKSKEYIKIRGLLLERVQEMASNDSVYYRRLGTFETDLTPICFCFWKASPITF